MVNTLFLITISVLPALASIAFLLPEANWSTRAKALAARGVLKVPLGLTIGFFGVILLEMSRQNVFGNTQLILIASGFYLFLFWFYLYLYKFILNKVLKAKVTWRAMLRAMLIEVGIVVALLTVSIGISLATNIPIH